MDDRTRSCTWDVFCEHLASYAEDEDFILVVQDDIDLGPLNGLPKDKIFVSSPSDPNMILNAAGMALSGKRPWVAGRSSKMIARSYSRPRCSNDNAFIESWHKTLKYTVGYPRFFRSLSVARIWYADFIQWYNGSHLHSALGYVTPLQRRSGEATLIYAKRNQTIIAAKNKNPNRWRLGRTRQYGSGSVETVYRPISKIA